MKVMIRVIQVIVALLFIVSGLIKANDPLGLAYKMEEFFELWITDLEKSAFFAKNALIATCKFLDGYRLFLSVTIITLEIAAGLALLTGWMKKWVLWLLLLLILFFTFLTGYAYLSGKFTNCGCFGDCIPITPFSSFIKDITLTVMIIILLAGQRYIRPVLSTRWSAVTTAAGLVVGLLIQWYVLNYLPLADCLAMKKGNNLNEQISPPKNAIPSVYESKLVYQNTKSGEVREFSQEAFNNSKIWEDTAWKWKETKTKLVQQGTDIPKLQNFVLSTPGGNDMTSAILTDPGYVLLYFFNPGKEGKNTGYPLLERAKQRGVSSYIVTTNTAAFGAQHRDSLLSCDGVVFRIAARVNPTIYLLKSGVILHKWPGTKMNDALNTISHIK